MPGQDLREPPPPTGEPDVTTRQSLVQVPRKQHAPRVDAGCQPLERCVQPSQDRDDVVQHLEDEGLSTFDDAWNELIESVTARLAQASATVTAPGASSPAGSGPAAAAPAASA